MLYWFQSINKKTKRLRNTCTMISFLRIYSSLYLGERILKWWCYTYFIPNHSYLLYIFLYCTNILITICYIESQGGKMNFFTLKLKQATSPLPKERVHLRCWTEQCWEIQVSPWGARSSMINRGNRNDSIFPVAQVSAHLLCLLLFQAQTPLNRAHLILPKPVYSMQAGRRHTKLDPRTSSKPWLSSFEVLLKIINAHAYLTSSACSLDQYQCIPTRTTIWKWVKNPPSPPPPAPAISTFTPLRKPGHMWMRKWPSGHFLWGWIQISLTGTNLNFHIGKIPFGYPFFNQQCQDIMKWLQCF